MTVAEEVPVEAPACICAGERAGSVNADSCHLRKEMKTENVPGRNLESC